MSKPSSRVLALVACTLALGTSATACGSCAGDSSPPPPSTNASATPIPPRAIGPNGQDLGESVAVEHRAVDDATAVARPKK